MIDPFKLLREAIKAVPSVKYALGLGGVAAVVAIVLSGLKLDPKTAVFGTLLAFVGMVVLVVFSVLATTRAGLALPALVLCWAFLVLTVGAATLFTSCFFFDYPKPLDCLLESTKCHVRTTGLAGVASRRVAVAAQAEQTATLSTTSSGIVHDNFIITLKGCSRNHERQVTCALTIKNTSAVVRSEDLWSRQEWSYLFDDLGRSYSTRRFTIAGQKHYSSEFRPMDDSLRDLPRPHDFAPGVEVPVRVYFENVSSDAKRAAVVQIWGFEFQLQGSSQDLSRRQSAEVGV